MYSIQETKEAIKFIAPLMEAIEAGTNKDFTSAFSKLGEAGMAAPAAFDNIALIPKELGELDETEKAELLQFAQDELDLVNDKVEAYVEAAVRVVYHLAGMFQIYKEMRAEA